MRRALKLGALAIANIGIAFLSQWYVLIQLGPGSELDALFAGMTIPQIVLAIISGSLMHALVPILAGEDIEQIRRDAWGLLTLVGGVFGLLAVVLYVSASWWVPLTVPGFSLAAHALTIDLTRIQLIGMVFAAINGVQWATHHAKEQFVWAEFTPTISGVLGLVLLMWAVPHFGVIAAAWINTLRMALQTILLAPGMGLPVWPDLRSDVIDRTWRRIKPLLWGTSYFKTDPAIDRFLLSLAGSGSMSLYYLAQQIYGAVSQVINKAIAAPMVPQLSRLHKAGDKEGVRKTYQRKIQQVCWIGSLGLSILGLFGQRLLDLLVGYGNVSAANVETLWWIMLYLGGMFIGGILGQISSSSFYALGNTKTPTLIGIYTFSLYVPMKIALFYCYDVAGLALATSAFYAVNFLLQHVQLRRSYF